MRGAIVLAACLTLTVACNETASSPAAADSAVVENSTALALTSNSWTQRAPIPDERAGFALGMAPNSAGESIVYLLGGAVFDVSSGWPAWRYNVATNRWSEATGGLFDVVNANGLGKVGSKLYFTGGQNCCDDPTITYNRTWYYDVSARRGGTRANLPLASSGGVSGVIGGKLYVLPGSCSKEPSDPGHCETLPIVPQLYRYDPSTNTWVTRRAAPHYHNGGAAGVIDDKLYVVGGNSSPYLDVYDPSTNGWQTRAPIPTPGLFVFGAVLQSKLFVISWNPLNSAGNRTRAYSYNPATNSWSSRAAPPNEIAGALIRVFVNGQAMLFLPDRGEHSYLYTP
jgi:hypothetical protein